MQIYEQIILSICVIIPLWHHNYNSLSSFFHAYIAMNFFGLFNWQRLCERILEQKDTSHT